MLIVENGSRRPFFRCIERNERENKELLFSDKYPNHARCYFRASIGPRSFRRVHHEAVKFLPNVEVAFFYSVIVAREGEMTLETKPHFVPSVASNAEVERKLLVITAPVRARGIRFEIMTKREFFHSQLQVSNSV